jgi:hypothetical protein
MKIITSLAALLLNGSAFAVCPFSVQPSGSADVTTDGLLLQRYALSLRESALIQSATRVPVAASTVASYISDHQLQLDVDGNGLFDVRDALITARYLAGFRSDSLVIGLPATAVTPLRDTAAKIEQYIREGCPLPSAPVMSTHPRLWLSDRVTLDRLVATANTTNPQWVKLKNFCDAKVEPDFDYQGSEPFRYIAAFSLCYRVVKATAGDVTAAPFAQKAINLLQSNAVNSQLLNFTNYARDSGYGIRNYVPAMAIAYDWLHDYSGMTATLKTQVATRLKGWLSYYATSGYANGTNYISNYNGGFMSAQVLTAIALYGEDAQSATLWSNAQTHFNGARQKFDAAMPGGHWPEGWNYGAGVYQEYLWSASALKMATNDSSYINFNWLNNNIRLKLNALTPSGKFFYDDGAWTGDSYGKPSLNDMMIAGHAFGWNSANGQLARSYIDHALMGGGNFNYPLEEWKAFLFYDAASIPANLTTVAKSFHAVGTGLVTMRADWALPAAAWASVVAGPYLSYQGTQDKDQGHIEIYKNTPLLVDVSHDYYGSNYTKNTSFQNTYTLENRSDSTYSGQNSYTDGCPNPTGSNPIGINAFIDSGAYVFTSGEFSAAYQLPPVDSSVSLCGPNAVSWLNRSHLFVRPGLFVVYDQIQKTSNQAAIIPTQHLHFLTAPTVQAGSSNRRLSVDNGGGRLQVATVLPEATNSVLRSETANADPGPNISNWHWLVARTDPSASYQTFLTVMRAGESTPVYTFPTITAITGTSASGSLISGLLAAESATPIVVMFAESGAPRVIPTTMQYQYFASSTTQNYIAKLKANTFYSVTWSNVSGMTTISVTESGSAMGTKADAAGVLSFSL